MRLSRRSVVAGLSAFSMPACFQSSFAQNLLPHLMRGHVLGPGPLGRCDDQKVGGPSVRWVEEKQRWFMWYYARDARFPKDVAPRLGTGRIALAQSKDGIAWDRFEGPMTGGAVMEWNEDSSAFDALHVGVGDVNFHNGKWHLWYFGGDTTVLQDVIPVFQFKGYHMRPGLATSPDGINWTRVKGTATGGALVDIGDNIYGAFPNGFHDGEKYILHFTTLDRDISYWRTKVATSYDGASWTVMGDLEWEHEPSMYETAGIVTRQVILNPLGTGPKWLMIYAGLDGRSEANMRRTVNAAVSEDGIKWRRLYDVPFFHPGIGGAWDGGGVAFPQLVTHKDELRLYYYGFNKPTMDSTMKGIGLAISTTGDLRDVLRVAA